MAYAIQKNLIAMFVICWKKYNICDTMKLVKEVCLYGIYQTNTNRGRILQTDDS